MPEQQVNEVTAGVWELVDRFENPAAKYGPLPIWWWSGEKVTRERLRWQMEQMVSQGVSQAVVMNLAPTGPLYGALADDPPFMSEGWWEIFLGACADAAELGFMLWLYDQIGFSGANIQGGIVAAHPAFAGEAIEQLRVRVCGEAASVSAPIGSRPIGGWFAPEDGSPSIRVALDGLCAGWAGDTAGELVICFAQQRGFDYFSSEASAALIDVVFGEYRRRCGDWFGLSIGGFFQDELPNMPTWSHDFAEAFEGEKGFDILSHLPALWGDTLFADANVDEARVRLEYHRMRAELAERAFFDPLADWYESAGLQCGFDQQTPAREGDPVGAVSIYGDYLEAHSRFGIPGSDHWGDSKVHSSLAHAGGHERVWIEAFHSSGWGGTLEETYDWLSPYLRRGATLYDPHAVYYSTRGGWWEWAPPSTCWRQPYWPHYHVFARAVTRLCSLLTVGTHVASTVLLFPTETVQSSLTADGRDLRGPGRDESYHQLNGSTAWFAERPGLLEAAGIDYDILGHSSLAGSRVEQGQLVVGNERFANVVLPAVTVLSAHVAVALAEFAAQGGRLVCVGGVPDTFVGDVGEELNAANAFAEGIAAGRILEIEHPADVAALLQAPAVVVSADAPLLHRRHGDTHIVTLIAHDANSGTKQPMLAGFERQYVDGGGAFDWSTYWSTLHDDGYEFVPAGDRPVSITATGVGNVEVQRWDPRTGLRSAVPFRRDGHDSIRIDTDFRDGSIAVLVIGPTLTAPTSPLLVDRASRVPVEGPWSLTAESTLDNTWGDLDDPARGPNVPIQVWEFTHSMENGDGPPARVTATFGPFAEIAGPLAEYPESREVATQSWRPANWSLSRGIENDPIHSESLGPNGYVPEEFLLWSSVRSGEWCVVRTHIAVPDSHPGDVSLAIGANAVRRVFIDGEERDVEGDGYLSFTPLSLSAAQLEVWFQATDDGDVRANFALTVDPEAYARPEWVELADGSSPSTTVEVSTVFEVGTSVTDARIQLSSEAPSIVFVNGVEVARQGDFDPYAQKRFTRVHPYDIAAALKPVSNEIAIRSTDVGRRIAFRLDSVPRRHGGLGLTSHAGWTATREGRSVALRPRHAQYEDPRYGCLVPRPHPLQGATWLEPAARDASVLPLVPDVRPNDGRVERLTFSVPLGAVRITVPSDVPFELGGQARAAIVDGEILFESPAAEDDELTLVFHPRDGRRQGALLNGPLSATVEEKTATLRPWSELGLGALGGAVRYRSRLPPVRICDNERLMVNLGSVRGTAEVLVDGQHAATMFGQPWRADIGRLAADGAPHDIEIVVRGTLAPYMQYASPTLAVMNGQTVHGLFGPVELETWRSVQ
jgi:hypothetical protein